ncbi:MAG: hypothetical protein COA79_14220 [Planctomycetota bacterium]|nr:MAG: hypothetical protein COA79_14220 [Planctomycetota bacterium]
MRYLWAIIFSIFLCSCGSVTVDMKDLRRSGDMAFDKITGKPFAGTALIYDEKTKNKIEQIEFEEGLMHGKSRGYFENGNKSYVAVYEKGKLISIESWEEDGTVIDE